MQLSKKIKWEHFFFTNEIFDHEQKIHVWKILKMTQNTEEPMDFDSESCEASGPGEVQGEEPDHIQFVSEVSPLPNFAKNTRCKCCYVL